MAPVEEVLTAAAAATGDLTSMEGAVTTEEIALAIVTVVAEEATEIRVHPVMIATDIRDRITAKGDTSGTILIRIHEIVVLQIVRGHAPTIHLRVVVEIMVVAAQAEIITAGIVAVPAVALPIGIMTVAAHPMINVAMIIILHRLVAAVAAAALAVIEWTIAAVAGDAAIDPGSRWDHRDRLLLVAPWVGVHRSARRWVRVGRRQCRRCVGVRHEVGLRVVSGTMDDVG